MSNEKRTELEYFKYAIKQILILSGNNDDETLELIDKWSEAKPTTDDILKVNRVNIERLKNRIIKGKEQSKLFWNALDSI